MFNNNYADVTLNSEIITVHMLDILFLGDRDVRKTGQEMDIIRERTVAYEYLCRLEEAKTWMEACLKEKLPHPVEFEECLRNGVYLAKLGNFISPELFPLNKIYDIDQRRYKVNLFCNIEHLCQFIFTS